LSKPNQNRLSEQAFAAIIRRYQRPLVALAYRLLGNLDDARDAAQETFVRLWQAGTWPDDESEQFALLAKITTRLCIDRLRRRKRRPAAVPLTGSEAIAQRGANSPAQDLAGKELRRQLEIAVQRLKPRQKAVFILRDVQGYSVRETAAIMDCSENSVLVNLHKARKNLRKWLTPYLNIGAEI